MQKGVTMSEVVVETQDNQEEIKSVDANAYESVKNDMHKYKRSYTEAQEKLNSLQSKLDEMERKSLEGSKQYKELYEQTQAKLKQVENEKSSLNQAIVNDKKFSAVEAAAIKAGLRDISDLEAFDLEGVEIETTNTGKYRVVGAEEFIENLKAKKPHWFKDTTVSNVNNSTGKFDGGKPKELNASEILKLQKENPAAYKDYMSRKFK